MNENDLSQKLSQHAFVQGMDERLLRSLRSIASLARFSKSMHLCKEGEPAELFYLICEGRVGLELHVPQRGAVRIQTLGPGEVVGWSWLFPPYHWQFDARVLEDVQAVALDGARLRALCEQHHELGYQVLKRLLGVVADRLAATRVQLQDIYR
ncbi:MAG: cyclic nucleotide-binding domain-containing protein [Planctomycetes bacterium]|nr:cyclic nucleotide-binding domain-containing protein [Planctomycetota bacterium]